ncbi:MAG TPA: NAD(P)H-dependent oxidoreductase subunit E [Acidimicrobiia bacterium]
MTFTPPGTPTEPPHDTPPGTPPIDPSGQATGSSTRRAPTTVAPSPRSERYRARVQEIVAQYPYPHSAILPLAHLAQDIDGWLSPEAMEEIADACQTTAADVFGVCSFYTMYKQRPCGRLVVSVCTNVTCLVLGGPELYEHLEHRYATDPDVFVEEVECLAACDRAPLMQVNYDYHDHVTHESAETIVEEYKSGVRTARGVSGGRVVQ